MYNFYYTARPLQIKTYDQILARNKPAGMNKHFSMAVAVEALANTLDEDRQVILNWFNLNLEPCHMPQSDMGIPH